MDVLLFIITQPVLASWWARAAIIGVAASAVLNISPRLPWLRDIEASRIQARWVGYVGLFIAFGLWVAFDPNCPAWQALVACGVIWFTTLVPNTLVHWRRESRDGDGKTQTVVVLPMESCEAILDHLVDPRRDLTIALENIHSAAIKAKKMADAMPDQISRQEWLAYMHESLGEAEERVGKARDEYTGLWEAVSRAWATFNDVRKQWGLAFDFDTAKS